MKPKNKKQQLNPANFDMFISNDMNLLSYSRKVHPTEVNIIWYLLYNANEQFRLQYQQSITHLKDKPKEGVFDLFKNIHFTFDMQELKEFCDDDEVVRKKLRDITNISAFTNSLEMGIDPLVTLESDPTSVMLISQLDGRKGTYQVCPHTLYKILLIPNTPYRPVSLILTSYLPSVKSKALYQILCAYSGIKKVQGKTISLWLNTINLKQTQHNRNYKKFISNHFEQMAKDINTHTQFSIDDAVRLTDQNTISITYKGEY